MYTRNVIKSSHLFTMARLNEQKQRGGVRYTYYLLLYVASYNMHIWANVILYYTTPLPYIIIDIHHVPGNVGVQQ